MGEIFTTIRNLHSQEVKNEKPENVFQSLQEFQKAFPADDYSVFNKSILDKFIGDVVETKDKEQILKAEADLLCLSRKVVMVKEKPVTVWVKEIEKAEETDIEKGGEGTRGGKIIGHTKSGKPIYDNNHANNYKDFTSQDHSDAEDEHLKKYKEHKDKDAKKATDHMWLGISHKGKWNEDEEFSAGIRKQNEAKRKEAALHSMKNPKGKGEENSHDDREDEVNKEVNNAAAKHEKHKKDMDEHIGFIKHEPDFVPDDLDTYDKWPEPHRTKAYKALEKRKKNFKQMSEDKKKKFE